MDKGEFRKLLEASEEMNDYHFHVSPEDESSLVDGHLMMYKKKAKRFIYFASKLCNPEVDKLLNQINFDIDGFNEIIELSGEIDLVAEVVLDIFENEKEKEYLGNCNDENNEQNAIVDISSLNDPIKSYLINLLRGQDSLLPRIYAIPNGDEVTIFCKNRSTSKFVLKKLVLIDEFLQLAHFGFISVSDDITKAIENGYEVYYLTEYAKTKYKEYLGKLPQERVVNPKDEVVNHENKRKIFIVHGHNETLKVKVARFLEKQNIQAIILHEQINEGKTIIEKFESNSNAQYAIVLMTRDDTMYKNKITLKNLFAAKKDIISYRARQNVILELGYFIAKLGRKNVAILYEKDIESPSDIQGVVYISAENEKSWKIDLAKELNNVGFNIEIGNI